MSDNKQNKGIKSHNAPLQRLVNIGVIELHDLPQHKLVIARTREVSAEVVRGHDVLDKCDQAPERRLFWESQKRKTRDEVEPLTVPARYHMLVKALVEVLLVSLSRHTTYLFILI